MGKHLVKIKVNSDKTSCLHIVFSTGMVPCLLIHCLALKTSSAAILAVKPFGNSRVTFDTEYQPIH